MKLLISIECLVRIGNTVQKRHLGLVWIARIPSIPPRRWQCVSVDTTLSRLEQFLQNIPSSGLS